MKNKYAIKVLKEEQAMWQDDARGWNQLERAIKTLQGEVVAEGKWTNDYFLKALMVSKKDMSFPVTELREIIPNKYIGKNITIKIEEVE